MVVPPSLTLSRATTLVTIDRDIIEGLRIAVSALGLCVLCFLLGSATVTFGLFPYDSVVRPSLRTLDAVDQFWTSVPRESPLATRLWSHAGSGDDAVVTRSERALFGYTFFASADLHGARLIDLDGDVIHEWEAPFDEVWPDASHLERAPDPDYVYWEDAEVSADGSVLAIYAAVDRQPRGLGLAEIGADSQPVWRLPIRAHSDLAVGPNGTAYALTRRYAAPADPLAGRLSTDDDSVPLDGIAVVSPTGNKQDTFDLTRAMAESPYAELLESERAETADAGLDATSVAVAGKTFAESVSFAEPGQLVVSLAAIDALVVVAPETGDVTWAHVGPWERPRGLELRPDGDIVLLETGGESGVTGDSRVLRYDPEAGSIDWSYGGTPGEPLSATAFGTLRCMVNGSLLVTDSDDGRIVEVVPGDGVVWSYLQPSRLEHQGEPYRPAIFAAERIRRTELAFDPRSK